MRSIIITAVLTFAFGQVLNAQCENWVNSPNKDEAENAHVIYRQSIKQWSSKKESTDHFNMAFENWQKAYQMAPAADGKRASHYTDGRKLYMHKLEQSTDPKEKADIGKIVLRLYDEEAQCYGPEYKVLGRKGYDMLYYLNSSDEETFNTLASSVEKGGNKSEYVVLAPTASVLTSLFIDEKVSVEKARKIYTMLYEAADHNIANNAKFKAYYEQAKDAMDNQFAGVKYSIFDCDYWKNELVPQYKADPSNRELYREVYKQLVLAGCDKEDPLLKEIAIKDESFIAGEKARIEREKQQNNPAWYASQLYKEGDYRGAVEQYKKAISDEKLSPEKDQDKLAGYYFSLASIEGRKLKNYSSAISHARDAASRKPAWGSPYVLIGDLYAMKSKGCGDSFEQRMAILAAVDKYAYAKSIDDSPELQSEANRKIASYAGHKPDKGEGHMRGVKPGSMFKVSCIGETVKVRFQ